MKIRRASRNQTKKHLALVTFLMWFNFLFFETVLRIRINRIHMFLGLLDPDMYPLVELWIPSRIPIRILLSLSKNSKKNLYFYCFVTSFWLFIFEKWCKSTLKSNMQKNFVLRIIFLLASWRSVMKMEGSGFEFGSGSKSQSIRGMDPRIRIRCNGSVTLLWKEKKGECTLGLNRNWVNIRRK